MYDGSRWIIINNLIFFDGLKSSFLNREVDLKISTLTLCFFLIAGVIWQTDLTAEDQNTIIYSYSHAPETYTKKQSGVLKVGITSFNPIVKVEINSVQVAEAGDSKVNISYPFTLKDGPNIFEVNVITEKGTSGKQFMIYLGKKPKPQKPVFRLIGIAGLSSLDNVTSAASGSDPKSGSKLSLTLVPRYQLYSDKHSILNLKGILLREKFSDSGFSSNEISFTQVAVEWVQLKTSLGMITAEAGFNDIKTDNANPLIGKDETMSEIFLSGKMKQQLGKSDSWHVGLKYKMKDSKATVTDPDVEADAAVISLKSGIDYKLNKIGTSSKVEYIINDAKGKYEDSSSIKLGIMGKYPMGKLTPSAGYRYSIKTKSNSNPSVSTSAQEDKLSTLTLKIGYQLWKQGQLSLDIKNKNQASNVDASVYSANIITLSCTHVF